MFECLRLYVGQHQPLDRLLHRLTAFDYHRVGSVMDPGDLAVHGGVIDLFPATFEAPLRIELHGSQIISMRSFNPKTLETLDRHTMIVILPRQIRTKMSMDVPFESPIDLKEGDHVVHLDHGVGRYLGRTTIKGKSGPHDALTLEYADGDRLYLPMDQLHLIQKYVAFGGRTPSLHKLGGVAWENAKTRAYVGAWTYAKGLLDLQAKRMALPGHAFPKDHPWQQTFESKFPYRETPDQLTVTADVKRDMEQAKPMDRLLLGDVGYGKTEVAIRAAFKAVVGQKQVALLVPTTILAYQHYRTFTKRMQDFPVQIAMLTRFQSEAEQREILHSLARGSCDIVIGTHRLLSSDVRFKDLGLLVVDEEQRFGVQDKERLKQWRSQMDVLTLSATPIPRTLYLALTGTRDLSLITTPPENRHPVETHIVEEEERSLRSWIIAEVNRKGQVYVVHNRVHNICQVAQRIAHLVPEARVGAAHGQMGEAELEQVMVAFIDGKLDVLVTTTIIESGIDIPNANTLIIRGAERFGLADLYQLRGRVGRFDRKAYAYLTVSKDTVLTEEARRRLEAMVEHAALGSGFKIAMEDLKIRGAGNLLGTEQSGHISAVGFDLYCRLLREAVNRIRAGGALPVMPAPGAGRIASQGEGEESRMATSTITLRPVQAEAAGHGRGAETHCDSCSKRFAPAWRPRRPFDRLTRSLALRRWPVALACLIGMMVCGGSSHAATETANRIIAVVNDDIITEADVASQAQAILEEQQQSAPERKMDPSQVHHEVLERLIEQRLILQDAKRSKISVPGTDVIGRLDELRNRFPSDEVFRQWLERSGFSEERLKERLRDQLLVQQTIDVKVRSTVLVSPQEVAKEIEAHPELSKPGDRIRTSHMLVRVNENRNEAEAKTLIEQIHRQLTQGADFAALAQRYSEDPHRDDGGAIGWVAQGELLPEIDTVLFQLAIGQLSGPIRTRLGFHLVRADERRPASSLSVSDANSTVYQRLFQQKFQERFNRWLTQLRQRAYIQMLTS